MLVTLGESPVQKLLQFSGFDVVSQMGPKYPQTQIDQAYWAG